MEQKTYGANPMNNDKDRFERILQHFPERFVDDFIRYELWNANYSTNKSSTLDEYNNTKDDILNQFKNKEIDVAYKKFNEAFTSLYQFLINHFYIPNSHYGMHTDPPFYYLEQQYHHNFYLSEGGRGAELNEDERSRIWQEFKASLEELGDNFHTAYKDFIRVAKEELEATPLWKNPIIITTIIGALAIIVPFGMWLWDNNADVKEVSIMDVQYELQDQEGDIIHRKSWQDNSILGADERNIVRMLVSIKLRNPNNFQVFAKLENYPEILENPYIISHTGDFLDEKYSIPANGDSGFIFAIDITPFTLLLPLSSSTKPSNIEFYDDQGRHLETTNINIANTYGMPIPYKVGVYNSDNDLIDTLEFNVRCRAQLSNLKAIFREGSDSMDMSKSINFECLPIL